MRGAVGLGTEVETVRVGTDVSKKSVVVVVVDACGAAKASRKRAASAVHLGVAIIIIESSGDR